MVKQLSIYLKNQPGELSRIMNILNDANVAIQAMCITDTNENGILRLVADKTSIGQEALRNNGINSHISRVLIVDVDGMAKIEAMFKHLNKHGLNVEYLYTYAPGLLVIKTDDAEQAAKLLENIGYNIISGGRE